MNLIPLYKIPGIFLWLSLAMTVPGQNYFAPVAVQPSGDGTTVFVAGADGRKVIQLNLKSGARLQEIQLPRDPTGLTRGPRGRLYVTGGGPDGSIFVCNPEDGTLEQTIAAGHTPMAPVLAPDGRTLYVCNRFNNEVVVVDLERGETTARIPVLREPVAADLTPDGRYLFVANHLPAGRADADYSAAAVSVVDTETHAVSTIPLVNGAEGLRGIRVSPDGRFVFATHQVARYLVPTTQLERGWVSTDGLSVIRTSDRSLLYTVLLDDVSRGFPNPWAIGFSGDGTQLIISSAGLSEVSLIDLPGLIDRIETAVKAEGHSPESSLSFLSGIRQRIQLQGKGARSLAVSGSVLAVAHYFSDTLELVGLDDPHLPESKLIPLGPKPVPSPERQGEILFNDASLCFQQWLSCATCHPDARTDGLNWDLLNDGIGNPKNAKSMLLAHATPRAMWLGVRDGAETAVRAGLRHIQFVIRPEADALLIDAYLKSLAPVPSPSLVNGKLSPAALRGQDVFVQAGCAQCHPAPLFTDLKMYDLKTSRGQDEGLPVDTPSLVEVWRTAPYLHDGRSATLREAIEGHHTAEPALNEKQMGYLIEYVNSL